MLTSDEVKPIADKIRNDLHHFESFHGAIDIFFRNHPLLKNEPSAIHSIKGRIKDPDHIEEKIIRKSKDTEITVANVYDEITDIAGIRVMHLYQDQFPVIHNAIKEQIDNEHWALFEPPKAYTWDPDSVTFFEELGLETLQKKSLYTSIHLHL